MESSIIVSNTTPLIAISEQLYQYVLQQVE